jgi:hypothetical protein
LVANCISEPSWVRWRSGSITPAFVDQQIRRPAPVRDEGRDRRLVGEVESADVDGHVAGGGSDVGGGPLTGAGIAHGERDFGARSDQRTCGLDPDTRGAAGDDRAPAGEVNAVDHLGGGRVKSECGLQGSGGGGVCLGGQTREFELDAYDPDLAKTED